MAAPSPLCFFAAWQAPFSAVSRFDGFYTFVLYLTRSVAWHDSTSCSREDSLDECERPCDTLSCLLFSALWLRCNYSILVQETQSAKDLVLTCFTTFPFNAVTCLQVGPMSLDWPVDPFARSDLSRSSLLPEVLSFYTFPLETEAQPQKIQRTTGWDGCGAFLSEGMRVLLGKPGALLDLLSPDKGTENSNSNIYYADNIICLQEVHGKAIQVLATQFQFFGTFIPDDENAGGSAICIHRDLLPEGAVVSYVITCQGRAVIIS